MSPVEFVGVDEMRDLMRFCGKRFVLEVRVL
jgi:hypothetical protein